MLELFSGSGNMARAFRLEGWEAKTIDFAYPSDLQIDVLCITRNQIIDLCGGEPNFIHASPPCTAFSVASIGANWTGGHRAYIPKSEKARLGIRLVEKTKEIISWFPTCGYTIENPRGVLRKLGILQGRRETICFCRYGDNRMKPTDIWTNLKSWSPRPMCHNGNRDHQEARRGAKTGTQGLKGAFERGVLPMQFCEEIAKSASNVSLKNDGGL